MSKRILKINTNTGLTNSQSYNNRNSVGLKYNTENGIKTISFADRFVDIVNQSDQKCADTDLGVLITDIITHYRNARDINFGEDFWSKFTVEQ